MSTKPMLMGTETEYSMSGRGAGSRPVVRLHLHRLLVDATRAEHPWLPDIRTSSGIYMDNGSRYYLDTGEHNELSSPELSTPRQVAEYDRAAERILLRAKTVVQQRRGVDVCITKNNINFGRPDGAAWGQHEAYTCWIPIAAAARQLIPHLVSRIPYAGAGCLSANPLGMGYELSQRARHMTRPIGSSTTQDRAIFCTRVSKPSDVSDAGWTRLNLISKDSQRCSFGMYLTYGVTGLLLMIANEGHPIGRGVALKNPVAAMQAFSLDPWLQAKVPLANGKMATAIEIQRAYLDQARPHVESGELPDWTVEVLGHWKATLDQLEADPLGLADRLDVYLKLAIVNRQLGRAGASWKELHRALQDLDGLRRSVHTPVVRAILMEDDRGLDGEHRTSYVQVSETLRARRCDRRWLSLAVQLQAMEMNYHELGGLFDKLDAAGHVDSVVVTPEAVDHAIHNPPPGGRAEARSKTIAEYSGQTSWACDWQYVINQEEEKWVDLRDPFAPDRKVTPLDPRFKRPRRPRLAELLGRLPQ